MHSAAGRVFCSLLAAGTVSTALGQTPPADDDALSLSSAPVEPVKTAPGAKLYVEAAAGVARERQRDGTRGIGRASIDYAQTFRLAPGWRATVSDRLDAIHPRQPGQDAAINSLREAYLAWQDDAAGLAADAGRMNLRSGPGYGYNPTDFFRDGTLRTITTANPFSLRENRLGTVALRGQRLWSTGSASLTLSPKLDSSPSNDGASADLGATNNRNRVLATISQQVSERISGQILVGKEAGRSALVGANVNALVSDGAVVHAEWTRSKEPSLLSRSQGLDSPASERNRFTGGATYTTASKLSITAEYQYNGFALDRAGWDSVRASAPALMPGYVQLSQSRQDLASRSAYFLYATQQSVGVKNLDVTALMRINAIDHSRLTWAEMRYHWSEFDLAVQVQQLSGATQSEFGVLNQRWSAQLVAAYFFK